LIPEADLLPESQNEQSGTQKVKGFKEEKHVMSRHLVKNLEE
jgi:hypothetical protein